MLEVDLPTDWLFFITISLLSSNRVVETQRFITNSIRVKFDKDLQRCVLY